MDESNVAHTAAVIYPDLYIFLGRKLRVGNVNKILLTIFCGGTCHATSYKFYEQVQPLFDDDRGSDNDIDRVSSRTNVSIK